MFSEIELFGKILIFTSLFVNMLALIVEFLEFTLSIIQLSYIIFLLFHILCLFQDVLSCCEVYAFFPVYLC